MVHPGYDKVREHGSNAPRQRAVLQAAEERKRGVNKERKKRRGKKRKKEGKKEGKRKKKEREKEVKTRGSKRKRATKKKNIEKEKNDQKIKDCTVRTSGTSECRFYAIQTLISCCLQSFAFKVHGKKKKTNDKQMYNC